MTKAWRAEYDESVKEVREAFESTANQLVELGNKFANYSPKQDKEQLSAYVLHARASLDVAAAALEKYVGQWHLHLTLGGYERGILGERSDTP